MNITKVNYEVATTAYRAKQLITELRSYPVIAWDFETAVKYTSSQTEVWTQQLEDSNLPKMERIRLQSRLDATALGHPSHCMITHCSMAISEDTGFVFIMDNSAITKYVLNYLVTSSQRQILHNASYDFRFLQYFTGEFPRNYEDTALLAKTLRNHVEVHKANVGLKDLAGHMYGDWGISTDNFNMSQMYDPKVLRYAATDACATFWLWQYINNQCDHIDQSLKERYHDLENTRKV